MRTLPHVAGYQMRPGFPQPRRFEWWTPDEAARLSTWHDHSPRSWKHWQRTSRASYGAARLSAQACPPAPSGAGLARATGGGSGPASSPARASAGVGEGGGAYGGVGGLVDQDEAAGGAVAGVGVGEDRLRQAHAHAADLVQAQ